MSYEVKVTGEKEIQTSLAKLEIQLRGPVLDKALNAGSKIIVDAAKATVRRGNVARYGKDKRAKKRLHSTIGVVLREYSTSRVAVVGPQYPAGAHGHLLELGHRIAKHGTGTLRRVATRMRKRKSTIQAKGLHAMIPPPKSKVGKRGMGEVAGEVKPYPFLEPAAEATKSQVQSAIETQLATLTNG